jgi:ssDNA-binding Zn-finger/Zn-ribbon topoisomerase 1
MARQVTIRGAVVTEHDLKCPECGAPMALKPSRFGLFYGCGDWAMSGCNGSHGAHKNGKPLGVPANVETKKLRMKAHEHFDKLWKAGKVNRSQAYGWLQRKMDMTPDQAHIGRFSSDDCHKLLDILKVPKDQR